MSITVIVGRPGDGKSYSAVHLSILPALKQGRSVFTNIELNIPLLRLELNLRDEHYLKYIPKETLQTSDLQNIPGGCLIVLDEVWRYWKAEERSPSTDDEKFFAEHRHKVGRMPNLDGMLSQDIVLISQNLLDIPRWIRGRVASTYKVEKLTAVGFDRKFKVDIHRGCNPRFPKDGYISSSISEYSSDVWRYYSSHTAAQETGGVDSATLEKGAVRNVSVWRSSRMLAYYAVLGFAVLFLGWASTSSEGAIFGNPDSTKHVVSSDSSTPHPPPLAVVPSVVPSSAPTGPSITLQPTEPPPPPIQETISDKFWISGYSSLPDKLFILLTDGQVTKKLKLSPDSCDLDNLECTHGNIKYQGIPLRQKSYIPDDMKRIAQASLQPTSEVAGLAGANYQSSTIIESRSRLNPP